MRILMIALIPLAVLLSPALYASDPPPRLIVRFDGALFGFSGSSMYGGGEGISVPAGGTGAGFTDGFGVEVGAEVRLTSWVAIDAGVAHYSPTLEVFRDMGPGVMVDSRSAGVKLKTHSLGFVVTPPRWRSERVRAAIGISAMRSEVSGIPTSLAITFGDGSTSLGGDARVDLFLSENGHWGIGGALALVDVDPQFTDDERASTGKLQMSEMRLKIGLRGAW